MENLKEERFFRITSEELSRIINAENLKSGFCSESDCKETMKQVWTEEKYMVDPHMGLGGQLKPNN